MKSIEELENSLFICIILLWQFPGMTIFRDQRWHHPDRKFVQHGWRGTCGSSLLHNTDFSTQRILSRQRTPSVASPDSGAPHGDHWFNGRLTFRSHFPILRWFFWLRYYFTVKFTQNKRNNFSGFVSERYALKSTANFFGVIFLEMKDILWSFNELYTYIFFF